MRSEQILVMCKLSLESASREDFRETALTEDQVLPLAGRLNIGEQFAETRAETSRSS